MEVGSVSRCCDALGISEASIRAAGEWFDYFLPAPRYRVTVGLPALRDDPGAKVRALGKAQELGQATLMSLLGSDLGEPKTWLGCQPLRDLTGIAVALAFEYYSRSDTKPREQELDRLDTRKRCVEHGADDNFAPV
jgi:hypothetical protein